jgi:hypothetical protein
VPNAPSTHCHINITVVDDDMGKDNDESGQFTIVAQPTVTITSPVTGDIWFMEDEDTIAFTLAGGVANWKVWINYTVDGSTYDPILGSQPFAYTSVGAKTKAWIVPSYTEAKFAKFAIEIMDTNNRWGSANSDQFTIDFPPVPPPEPTIEDGITITFTQVGDWTGGTGGVTARTGEDIPISTTVKTSKGVAEAKIIYQLPQSNRIYEICIYSDGVSVNSNSIGDMALTEGTIYNGEWSGDIPAQDGSGKIYYQVYVKDKDGNVVLTPLTYLYVLTAEETAQAAQPTLDWNLVIMGVVLVSLALVGLAVWDYRRRR